MDISIAATIAFTVIPVVAIYVVMSTSGKNK